VQHAFPFHNTTQYPPVPPYDFDPTDPLFYGYHFRPSASPLVTPGSHSTLERWLRDLYQQDGVLWLFNEVLRWFHRHTSEFGISFCKPNGVMGFHHFKLVPCNPCFAWLSDPKLL